MGLLYYFNFKIKMKNLLNKIYQTRYPKEAEKKKDEIWKVLCEEFLQKFVRSSDTVLDLAAGHCEFINHIKAREKYAIDIDKRVKRYATKGIRVLIGSATSLPKSLTNKIDVVFIGCFLEHLPSKEAIIRVFLEVKRALKKGGKLLILNHNIRFSTYNFWDYFDHLTPVSDRSVVEILEALGYKIELCLPKFVPNTIKDRLQKSPLLVRLYLHLPFLFPIFGKQMFIVAHKV